MSAFPSGKDRLENEDLRVIGNEELRQRQWNSSILLTTVEIIIWIVK
jgi:hypothetical protein